MHPSTLHWKPAHRDQGVAELQLGILYPARNLPPLPAHSGEVINRADTHDRECRRTLKTPSLDSMNLTRTPARAGRGASTVSLSADVATLAASSSSGDLRPGMDPGANFVVWRGAPAPLVNYLHCGSSITGSGLLVPSERGIARPWKRPGTAAGQ